MLGIVISCVYTSGFSLRDTALRNTCQLLISSDMMTVTTVRSANQEYPLKLVQPDFAEDRL